MRVQGSPTKNFFPTSIFTLKQVKIGTDKLLVRKKAFLQFVTQKPLSKFKELIVTSPTLLRGHYTMSMTKTASDGLKARECERIKLREKIEKLEKALKKSGKRGKKRRYEDSVSDSK